MEAWGEVGLWADSTGPLGAWYKRFDFWWESKLDLSDIIFANEIAIVPDQRYLTVAHKESEDFMFEAPTNMVLVGRRHEGDENGETICMYASLKAIDASGQRVNGTIEIVDEYWSGWHNENESGYQTPNGYVLLGRQHIGDENGQTRYKVGRILFNGKHTNIYATNSLIEYQFYVESQGVFFQTEPYFLYTGRVHGGDENGWTRNIQSLVKVAQ